MRMSTIVQCIAMLTLVGASTLSQAQRDLVKGNMIQFNDNGAWCRYQDERAVVDTIGRTLIVGSVADESGVGGSPRGGDIDAVLFILTTRTSARFTLKEGGGSAFYADDHNAPAFIVRPSKSAARRLMGSSLPL